MQNKVDQLIRLLSLQPHPEGGYFKETYRSAGKTKANFSKSDRHFSTCIYFLLTSNTFSAFHRIHQDEIWHFYDGAPIELHTISPNGIYKSIRIGCDVLNGETPQYIVMGGNWFAATVINDNSYSLVGCTVAPGFDFADFHLAKQTELTALFPQHKTLIKKLTRT